MADAPETNESEGAAPEKKKSKVVAMAAIGVFLIGGAVTAGLLAFPGAKHSEEAAEDPKVVSLLPIPQVLVNLSQKDSQRLLQATMSVEVRAETEAIISDRFNVDLPKVQDLLIKVLSAYAVDDLAGGSNKQAVQARLVKELNEKLFSDGAVEVSAVYFTEFIVQ